MFPRPASVGSQLPFSCGAALKYIIPDPTNTIFRAGVHFLQVNCSLILVLIVYDLPVQGRFSNPNWQTRQKSQKQFSRVNMNLVPEQNSNDNMVRILSVFPSIFHYTIFLKPYWCNFSIHVIGMDITFDFFFQGNCTDIWEWQVNYIVIC